MVVIYLYIPRGYTVTTYCDNLRKMTTSGSQMDLFSASPKQAQVIDPAANYPTKASRKAAEDAWDIEWQKWAENGMIGEYPHPPAGLVSAIADQIMKNPSRPASPYAKTPKPIRSRRA
jgi:hypothetical protein